MAILIPNEVAKQLVSVRDAIEPMRSVFIDLARGKAETGPRYRMPTEAGFMQWGPGRWDTADRLGYKVWVNSGSPLSGAWIHLYKASTGELLAVLEAHHVSLCRTSAVSLLGAQIAVPADQGPVTIAVFGTGRQARGQIEAMCIGYDVASLQIHGRDPGRREAFARDVEESFRVKAVAVDEPRDAVAGADIVVTATSSSTPVLHGAWLDEGTRVVVGMGANRVYERELDEECVRQMKSIVVDDLGEAKSCCGDLLYLVEKGRLNWNSVGELGEVLDGSVVLEHPTLFESQGLSVTDVAIADWVYHAALESGHRFETLPLT